MRTGQARSPLVDRDSRIASDYCLLVQEEVLRQSKFTVSEKTRHDRLHGCFCCCCVRRVARRIRSRSPSTTPSGLHVHVLGWRWSLVVSDPAATRPSCANRGDDPIFVSLTSEENGEGFWRNPRSAASSRSVVSVQYWTALVSFHVKYINY